MHRIVLLLAATAVAFAETGGPDPAPTPVSPTPGATGTPGGQHAASPFDPTMILIMVGLFAFMWFVVIRPQKKEEKRRQELINSMKPGHKVITIGGLHGEVVAVGEGTVDVRVGQGEGMVMTFNKGAISTNVTAAGPVAPAK